MLDLISTVNSELTRLNCPASTLANLSGVPSGSLSGYLNGGRSVPRDHAQQIQQAMTGLKRIVESCRPIPIDFRQVGLLRDLIADLEAGALHVNIIRSECEPSEPTFHVFVQNQYFVERNPRNSYLQYGIRTTANPKDAPLLGKEIADEIFKSLANLGLKAHVIPSDIGLARSSSPERFEDIWQTEPVQEAK